MLWVAVDFNVENDMPSFSSQAIFMVCNVLYCSVTLLTLQLESYVTDPCQKASGARRPKAEGVRMDAHRAETGVHAGLGSRQPPPERGTHRPIGVSQAEYWKQNFCSVIPHIYSHLSLKMIFVGLIDH